MKKLIRFLIKIVFLATTFFLFYVGLNLYTSDSSFVFNTLYEKKLGWNMLIDYSSNSVYMWSIYKGIFKLTKLFMHFTNFHFNDALFIINIFIFFISTSLLSINLSNIKSKSFCLFASFSLVTTIFLFFGNKTYLISSISILPLYILSLVLLTKSTKFFLLKILFSIFIGIILIKSSNEFSFLYLIFSLFSCLCINKEIKPPRILFVVSCILICYSLVYIIFYIPHLPSFNYPFYAKVVLDDGLPGNIIPLINEETPIPFINEALEKSLYIPFTFILCLYIFIVIFKSIKNKTSEQFLLSLLILFLIISLILDIYLPPKFSSIMFISTIRRIIPSLFMFSVYPNFLFFLIFLFYIFCIKYIRNFTFFYLLNISLVIYILCFNIQNPIAINKKALNFINKVKENKLFETNDFRKVLLSPSNAVYIQSGLQYYTKKDILNNHILYKNLKYFNPTLESNYNKKDLKNILNKNPNERWTTKKGYQEKDEEVKIKFDKPYEIQGVIINVGNFITDFPEEIKITSCDGKTLYIGKNLGEIKETEDGIPYYASQEIIKAILKNKESVDCLKIINLTKHKDFEWSIAKIKILLAK